MKVENQGTVKVGKVSTFFLFLASFQEKHWVVSLIFFKLSALWFSLVLSFAGESLKLIAADESGRRLTVLGWGTTVAIFGIILLFEIAKNYEQKMRQEPYELNGYFLLNKLRVAISSICDAKLKTLISEIDDIKCCRKQNLPVIVSNPSRQLELIAQQAVSCLDSLLSEDSVRKVKDDDIYLTIAYQFPQEDNNVWHWATEEHGLGFEELLSSDEDGRRSTFYELINGGRNYEFFNRKEEAYKKKIYKPDDWDDRDESNELMGSIACYKFEIKKNDKIYIRAVVSITSYTHQFTSDNSKETVENVRHNMHDFVIFDFSKRIKTELCLLYLQYLNEHLAQ